MRDVDENDDWDDCDGMRREIGKSSSSKGAGYGFKTNHN